MATIRKRQAKWQVQVRRQGAAPLTRTFTTKAGAQSWARQVEADIETMGLHKARQALGCITIRELLSRYRDTIIPQKRARDQETTILNRFLREPLADKPLSLATPAAFAALRDERLKTVKPATVCRELGVISHAFETARKEWGIPLNPNPLSDVRRPKLLPHRQRRLSASEEVRLHNKAAECRNQLMPSLVKFALSTAMRQGELLRLRWSEVNWERYTLSIPVTKNDHPRTIPLSQTAVDLLRAIGSNDSESDRVFPMTARAVKLAWRRLMKRSGISDLHFHDLRHEAISRFFELGLSVPEVALISGHKDARMLFRYTHMRAEEVSAKLRTRCSGN